MKIFIFFTVVAFGIITWVSKTEPSPAKQSFKYGFPKTFLEQTVPNNEFDDGDMNINTAAFLLDVMCAMPIGWACSFAIKKMRKK